MNAHFWLERTILYIYAPHFHNASSPASSGWENLWTSTQVFPIAYISYVSCQVQTSLNQKDMTTLEPRIMRQAVNSRQAMSEDDILHLSLSLRVKKEQEKPSLAWDNFRM